MGGGGEQMNIPLISGGVSLLCIKQARHIYTLRLSMPTGGSTCTWTEDTKEQQ